MKQRPLITPVTQPVMPPGQREILYERFRKVIMGAGYTNPQPILESYFDLYMEDVPGFVKMLEDYENNNYDPKGDYSPQGCGPGE